MRAPDRGPDALATLVKRLLPAAATVLVIAALVSPAPDAGTKGTLPADPGASGRKLVFADDFNGTRLNTASWSPYNSAGNAGHGLRRRSALSLDGHGHLVITAHMINGRIVSGGMSNRLNQTYGLFEFRVRTDPDTTGIMSGMVLTWPQSGRWAKDGEE